MIVTVKLCPFNCLEMQNLLHLCLSSGKLVEPKQRGWFLPFRKWVCSFGFQGMAKYVGFSHLNPHLNKALHGQRYQEYIGNLDSVSCGIVHLVHIFKPF